MSSEIDYMRDAMKAGWNRDVTTATSVDDAYFAGWRAACRAMAAKRNGPPVIIETCEMPHVPTFPKALPGDGWKAYCHVECSGWSSAIVRSSSGDHILTKQGTWISINDPKAIDCYFYGTRDHPASIDARAALAACSTPPPGVTR